MTSNFVKTVECEAVFTEQSWALINPREQGERRPRSRKLSGVWVQKAESRKDKRERKKERKKEGKKERKKERRKKKKKEKKNNELQIPEMEKRARQTSKERK